LFESTIRSADIRKLYKIRYQTDVNRFFPDAETIRLVRAASGYYRFTSALAGDDLFYVELMSRLEYPEDRAEFRKAAEYIGVTATVLDIGCGPGGFSTHCRGTYKGIDLNPEAVQHAQSLGRNVVLERLEDQASAGYDVVTMFQVLEHVIDPEVFLASAARCVAAGGILIVSTPNMRGFMGHARNQELNYPPHHMSWWSGEAIASLLRTLEFNVINVWEEPLQRGHFPAFFSALMNPLGPAHFDFSVKAKLIMLAGSVFKRLVHKKHKELPFIAGHSVMVTATNRTV
jgi:SAM-dependent methyltransferase